ncbi:MAG: hypothetical protein K5675_09975 [Lachnospiraceae bacterium]|nr:hypothetical protein [Lachnospiraceae bacterium]
MFINFSNHGSKDWSKEQIKAAEDYGEIRDVPFPNVAAEATEEEINALADQCVEQILSFSPKAVMCQGEFTLCYAVIQRLKRNNIICLAACSLREATVKQMKDGSTKRVSVFKFCKFREYK